MKFQHFSEASSEAIAQDMPRKLRYSSNDGVSTMDSMNRSMTHGTGSAGRQAAARLLQSVEKRDH